MAELLYFALIFCGMLLGLQGERWRAAWARKEWRARRGQDFRKPGLSIVRPPQRITRPDSADQLRLVMNATYERRRLLTRKEAEIFRAVETSVEAERLGWRVMAQVNLGEILTTPDAGAFAAINSKRVDILIVCNRSLPLAAVEYQGEGHYQGSAAARDAVKKEALRKAGIRYFEVTPALCAADIGREVSRMAKVERLKRAS